MTADPKWLDIIKASGWQTTAIAVGCGALYTLISTKILPDPGGLWVVAIAGGGIICACLALSSILSALVKFIDPAKRFRMTTIRRNFKRQVRDYIPFMTEEERAIIAYLLHHRQKMFTCADDGGNAVTLISKGIVYRALRGGQVFGPEDMPVAVHDDAWDILEAHREQFPYRASKAHPWRVNWMAR
jgi:hypothetical protein